MTSTGIDLSRQGLRDLLEDILFGAQRSRSISQENPDFSEEAWTDLSPWLFGPKSIMPTLTDLAMSSAPIEPGTILNLLSIAHRFEPGIVICAKGELPTPAEFMAAMAARSQTA